MFFDPENPINKLCAEGMEREGEGNNAAAAELFQQAWNAASNALEKCTAAHYVARHQQSVADKLKWDQTALEFALQVENPEVKGMYPSLYLNVGKGFEDLNRNEEAKNTYETALNFVSFLGDDGYGKLITRGIQSGLERVS